MLSKKDIANFKIIFDGELHQVDANTFLNSLFHTIVIIKQINEELNKELSTEKKIEIKINALNKGSFQVDLELVSGFAEAIGTLITGENIIYSAAIVTILNGLVILKLFLKGEKPKSVQKSGEAVLITDENNQKVHIDQRTYNIYNNNHTVNEAISKNFEGLKEDESINAFEISAEKQGQNVRVERKEFEDLAKRNILLEETQNTEKDYEAKLNIVKLAFESNFKWVFYYKGNKISAHILDKDFFKRIDAGEESFCKGDILVSELQINKVFDKTVNTYVNESYQVNKVHQHIPINQQENIDFADQ